MIWVILIFIFNLGLVLIEKYLNLRILVCCLLLPFFIFYYMICQLYNNEINQYLTERLNINVEDFSFDERQELYEKLINKRVNIYIEK